MRVSNFKYDPGTKTGSVKISISTEDLMFLLDRERYFCHVFKSILRSEYHYSFGIHRTSIQWIEFDINDFIKPFREKLPNRFRKKNAATMVIGSSMFSKYTKSSNYRQNLVLAMKQDVFVWDLKFAVFD